MKIDAVITWVDGDDPRHIAKRQQYGDKTIANRDDVAGATRYRSVGEIFYCVASLNKFAPWLNKIYIVTDEQDPMLDEKIKELFPNGHIPMEIVDHKVIFRGYEQYLPTFNSVSIESMTWRIPGLSEYYIEFNDDLILTAPTKPEDFFLEDGTVVCYGKRYGALDTFATPLLGRHDYNSNLVTFRKMMYNATKILGKRYGLVRLYHTPKPLRRSIFEKLFAEYPEHFISNIRHRFRNSEQFNVQVVQYILLYNQKMCALRMAYTQLLYMDSMATDEYVTERLSAFDERPNHIFGCFNSIDLMSKKAQRMTIEWIERRIGMRDEDNQLIVNDEQELPKISIVVAVYNAEAYLDICLKSIFAQTFTNYEVLLINDGSTDSSGTLCDKYASQDRRIRVIHKSNGGVATARQVGIENARGEFSIHVDPDDTMEPRQLETLYREAQVNGADMVICDFYKRLERITKYSSQRPTTMSASGIIDDLLNGKLHGPLWNKLIRTSLYRKYDISFVPGLNYCEDLLVCVKLLLHDIKVAYVDKPLYTYNMVINSNSITRNYSLDKFKLRLLFLQHVFAVIPEGEHEKSKGNIITAVAYQCLQWGILSDEEFAKTFGNYQKYFKESHYSLKRRIALRLSSNGRQTLARRFIKKKR